MDREAGGLKRSALTPYLIGLAALAAGALLRFGLDDVLGQRSAFLFLAPGLLLAAGIGGLAPGLCATALATVLGLALAARHGLGLGLGMEIETALFALFGIGIAFAGRRLQRSRRETDASNRHVAEREAHLQSILDTVPEAMVVIDETGVVRSFSTAAQHLFGWSTDEIIGQNVRRLMPTPDREGHDGYLHRYAREGQARIIGSGRVVLAERKDGSVFPIHLSIGEMGSPGHKFFTGFMRDLTEQQDAQRRLQDLQSELIEISRFSAMGEMAAALAHELNQPLSAMANYLRGGRRLLLAENPQSSALEPMQRAAEQSVRAGQIIRRLRDFISRGESERTVESLPRLVNETAALGLTGARERGVRTEFRLDPDVDGVLVDRVQIQQVLLNLIRNGIDAMADAPQRELVVITEPVYEQMAQISVVDTGAGVDPDVAERLFQPFVSTKGQDGMGIGLSICRTIVEAHGGRIWTEPNPAGGAIFRFTLPRAGVEELVDD